MWLLRNTCGTAAVVLQVEFWEAGARDKRLWTAITKGTKAGGQAGRMGTGRHWKGLKTQRGRVRVF